MGQRFQVFIKTDFRLYGYHLQWSWGEHSIIRGYQLIDYFKNNLGYKYSEFNSESRKNETNELFKGLIGYNTILRSYVTPQDLVNDFRDYNCEEKKYTSDYEDSYLKFEKEPINTYDNNDGVLVIDVRNNKLKYCYYYDNNYSYSSCETEKSILTAREYLALYRKENTDEESKKEEYIKEKHLKIFDKIELLTKEDLIRDFNLKTPKDYSCITIKEALEDDNIDFDKFYDTLSYNEIGYWDEVNDTEIIKDYITDMIRDDIGVSHILTAIENEYSEHDLWKIWLGNSMEKPEPINTKEDLVEALNLQDKDLEKELDFQ